MGLFGLWALALSRWRYCKRIRRSLGEILRIGADWSVRCRHGLAAKRWVKGSASVSDFVIELGRSQSATWRVMLSRRTSLPIALADSAGGVGH